MGRREKPLLALTLGDIAGIGPEIAAKTLMKGAFRERCRLLVADDASVLRKSFQALGALFNLPVVKSVDALDGRDAPAAVLDTAHADARLAGTGHPDPATGRMAGEALARAIRLAMDGNVDGLVYAPLCKDTLRLGDKRYSDELGLFKDVTGAKGVARLAKAGEVFRTSVTEHIPFRQVADLITRDRVLGAIELLNEALRAYGLRSPTIAVAALNPHAGEGGHMGTEEPEQIAPAIQEARARGIDALGPFPADTIYVRAFKGEFNGVVSLYHDQANIALKAASFGQIVIFNVRCPVVAASPSHGTAFDIAGKGVADAANLESAITLATAMARQRMEQD